jgi:hypothetical protein
MPTNDQQKITVMLDTHMVEMIKKIATDESRTLTGQVRYMLSLALSEIAQP